MVAPGYDPGPRPDMAWIGVDLIDVDSNYQRPLGARHARRIAADWKWANFQPPSLTPKPGGRYWCFDGQHRVVAAKAIIQIVEIPCYIVAVMDRAGQASAFVAINESHQRVTQLEKFRAGLVSGNATYQEIQEIVDSIGLRFVGSQQPQAMRTKALGRVLAGYKTHGSMAVRKALMALAQAWPTEPEAFSASMISSMITIFGHGPTLQVNYAADQLRQIKPTKFLADFMVRAKEEGRSASSLAFLELHRRLLGTEFKR